MKVDVGIVGGGVAGSTLAHVLSRAGASVALVEREAEFRDRIRGEAVHPWGTREIDRLNLRPYLLDRAEAHELPVWQTYRGRVQQDPTIWTRIDPGIPPVISVRHPVLQEAMFAAAEASGAHIFRPATVELDRNAAGPVMRVRHEDLTIDIETRLLVGADGSHSATRQWLGGEGVRDPIHHYMAGALLTGLDLPSDAAHHASGPGGFTMIFPQSRGIYRLYFICLPHLRDAMKGASQPDAMIGAAWQFLPERPLPNWEAIGPAGFFPNADIVSTVTSGPGAVLIGDAAGANDPSLGHGLGLVFRDVREISELVLGGEVWESVPDTFAHRRATYYSVLREHARWTAGIATSIGPEADAARERVARAREADPTAGGFAGLFAYGPDGLVADESARRHFLGLDLD